MPLLRFLFWNLNQNAEAMPLVSRIAVSHGVDIVILSELPVSVDEAVRQLNDGTGARFRHAAPSNLRVNIFGTFDAGSIRPIHDEDKLAIREITLPGNNPILIAAVHLSSKLHFRDQDQAALGFEVATEIERREGEAGHERTLVVGDFNMNPFEAGLVSSPGGFNATMTRGVAGRRKRKVQGEDRRFFYNPMWNHFGDQGRNPPGTYYRQGSAPTEYFWNMFDQVLVRPSLMAAFPEDELKILTAVEGHSLVGKRGRPNPAAGSDHLPLLFALSI